MDSMDRMVSRVMDLHLDSSKVVGKSRILRKMELRFRKASRQDRDHRQTCSMHLLKSKHNHRDKEHIRLHLHLHLRPRRPCKYHLKRLRMLRVRLLYNLRLRLIHCHIHSHIHLMVLVLVLVLHRTSMATDMHMEQFLRHRMLRVLRSRRIIQHSKLQMRQVPHKCHLRERRVQVRQSRVCMVC